MWRRVKQSIKTQLSIMPLLFTVILSGILLSSSSVSASTDTIDTIELTVPVACTMSGTGQTSHNATLNPGTYSGASGSEYEAGIGKTTLTTYCNDNNGFSIYAIGFTNDLYEGESHTKLIGQNTNQSISTKVYTNGDTDSNWSMKVNKVDNPVSGDPITYNPDNMSIQNSFNSWHEVPDIYTKVAQYNSSTTDPATTDTTLGAKLETTYATYISSSQPADTYTGQVKYTLVHPYNHTDPEPPSFKVLYTGRALSNEPGQENPVTVRMADLPQDGKYNLLGTENGLYDKLTPNKLYGGYFKYIGDYDIFSSEYLDNYEIYDGTNFDFPTLFNETAEEADGASFEPTNEAVYIVKEVPGSVYLQPHGRMSWSGINVVGFRLITDMDDWIYREVNFNTVVGGNLTERHGTMATYWTITYSNGNKVIIRPTDVNSAAIGENNVISHWRDTNKEFLTENLVFEATPYWITYDNYKVTGMTTATFRTNDLTTTNFTVSDATVPSQITKLTP